MTLGSCQSTAVCRAGAEALCCHLCCNPCHLEYSSETLLSVDSLRSRTAGIADSAESSLIETPVSTPELWLVPVHRDPCFSECHVGYSLLMLLIEVNELVMWCKETGNLSSYLRSFLVSVEPKVGETLFQLRLMSRTPVFQGNYSWMSTPYP